MTKHEDSHQWVLHFHGQGQIDLGIKPEHEPTTCVTIEAWIWVEKQVRYTGIVSKIFHTGATQSGYGILLDGKSGIMLAVKQTDSPILYHSSGPDTIQLKTWHHVAFTFDTNEKRLYVDGVLMNTWASTAGAIDYEPPNSFKIGRYHDDNETYDFKGKITEVRLWSEVRSAEAINATMRTRIRKDQAGLIGYWPLDEGSGETAGDRSVNDHGGTIDGATWEETVLPLGPAEPAVDHEAELATLKEALAAREKRITALEEQVKDCADCKAALAEKTAELAVLLAKMKALPNSTDDITDIEGVGPKTAEILKKGGITTFAQLAVTAVSRLQALLATGGSRFSLIDPTTWPEQARLAAAGDRAALKIYQDTLDGGRPTTDD